MTISCSSFVCYRLLSGHFSLLTLSDELNPDTTNDFIRDLLEILDQKETPTIKSPIGGCNGSIQIELLEENQLMSVQNWTILLDILNSGVSNMPARLVYKMHQRKYIGACIISLFERS